DQKFAGRHVDLELPRRASSLKRPYVIDVNDLALQMAGFLYRFSRLGLKNHAGQLTGLLGDAIDHGLDFFGGYRVGQREIHILGISPMRKVHLPKAGPSLEPQEFSEIGQFAERK